MKTPYSARLRSWVSHNWELAFILVICAAVGILFLLTEND
jgi:hypothetical protein